MAWSPSRGGTLSLKRSAAVVYRLLLSWQGEIPLSVLRTGKGRLSGPSPSLACLFLS
jgi:hypothetical protein